MRDIIFMKNNKLLKISFIENRDLFYYLNFNLEDTFATIDENIP